VQLRAVDRHPTGARLEQPGEHEGEFLLAAAVRAHDRDVRRQAAGERHPLEQPVAALAQDRHARGAQLARELGRGLGLGGLQTLVLESRRHELGDRLLVLDLHIVEGLIVAQKLAPGRGDILLGGDHGGERADRHLALQHEVATDRVEEERAELGDEVVQELDQELLLVDVVTNPEHRAELLAELRPLVRRGVVGAHVARPRRNLADLLGVATDLAHPLLAQRVDLPLQLGDQPDLQGIERHRCQTQHPVLHEHEEQAGEQRAGLQPRRAHRLADEPPQGLGLGVDHLHQLALADPAVVGQGKAQHVAVELVAQPAQHALGDDPGEHVDHVLDQPADKDDGQEQAAQQPQKVEPAHHVAVPFRARVGAQRPVHDLLGQLVGEIVERQEGHAQRQDHELLAPTVLDDERGDSGFHPGAAASLAVGRRSTP
jgi:hypothetical protein